MEENLIQIIVFIKHNSVYSSPYLLNLDIFYCYYLFNSRFMFLLGHTKILVIIIIKIMMIQFINQSALVSAYEFIETYLNFKF